MRRAGKELRLLLPELPIITVVSPRSYRNPARAKTHHVQAHSFAINQHLASEPDDIMASQKQVSGYIRDADRIPVSNQ